MNSFRRIIHATGFSSVFKRIMHAQFFFCYFVLFCSSLLHEHFTSVVRIRMRVVEFYCQFTALPFYLRYPFELMVRPWQANNNNDPHTTCFHSKVITSSCGDTILKQLMRTEIIVGFRALSVTPD